MYGRFRVFRGDVCREIGCSKMLAICCIQSLSALLYKKLKFFYYTIIPITVCTVNKYIKYKNKKQKNITFTFTITVFFIINSIFNFINLLVGLAYSVHSHADCLYLKYTARYLIRSFHVGSSFAIAKKSSTGVISNNESSKPFTISMTLPTVLNSLTCTAK